MNRRTLKKRIKALKKELADNDDERMGKMLAFPLVANTINYQLIGRLLCGVQELPGDSPQKSAKEQIEEDRLKQRRQMLYFTFAHTEHLGLGYVEMVRQMAKKHKLLKNRVKRVLMNRKDMLTRGRYSRFIKSLNLHLVEDELEKELAIARQQEDLIQDVFASRVHYLRFRDPGVLLSA